MGLTAASYCKYLCIYRTRVISTRGYYSFWGFLVAILFRKIKEVTKNVSTIQERVLNTPVRYILLQKGTALFCLNFLIFWFKAGIGESEKFRNPSELDWKCNNF